MPYIAYRLCGVFCNIIKKMIRIFLGNVGSGKTACAVRDMYLSQKQRVTYSNIITKFKFQKTIMPEMIVKKELAKTVRRKSGETEAIYKYSLNIDYWKDVIKKQKAINIIIDEAHTILNARRSMSRINIIISDWLALVRRVLGSTEAGHGELCFITQLPNRIDIIAREMATQVRYHVYHYKKTCKTCDHVWAEHSEMPEPRLQCPRCGNFEIKKFGHNIEVWHFANMNAYTGWKEFGAKSFYKHYIINDIEKYFKFYDTLQWDNMFSSFY